MVFEADAVTGRRLTGNRNVRILDIEVIRQRDSAGHFKHDRARAACFDRLAQTARSAVLKIRNDVDRAASPADGPSSRSARAGKRGYHL